MIASCAPCPLLPEEHGCDSSLGAFYTSPRSSAMLQRIDNGALYSEAVLEVDGLGPLPLVRPPRGRWVLRRPLSTSARRCSWLSMTKGMDVGRLQLSYEQRLQDGGNVG